MLLPVLARVSWHAIIFAFSPLTLGLSVGKSLPTPTSPTLFVVSGGYSLLEGARSRRNKGYTE